MDIDFDELFNQEEQDYEQKEYDQEFCDNSWECRDFSECDDDLKSHDEEYCWVEKCFNECGEDYCNVFRTDESQYNEQDGTYYWSTEECPVDPTEELAAASVRSQRVASTFEHTFMTAFENFCAEGQCIEGSNMTQTAPND